MNARSLIICTAMLFCAGGVYADGNYQRTKDGKTLIWNNDPRPEDAAKWSGGRDEDGYATGYGGLTWYKVEKTTITGSNLPVAKKTFVSRYSGNMVKGKFEGQVLGIDTRGKLYHAAFANGARRGKWAAGAAPLPDQEPEEPVHRKRVLEQAENVTRPTPKLESVREQAVQIPKVEPPAEGPSPIPHQSPKPEVPKSAEAEKPDDSVRSLAMPPSSLRINSEKASPEPSEASTSSSTPAPVADTPTPAP